MSAKDHQPATGATPLEPPEAATTLVVDALGTPDHGSQAPSPAPSSPEAMERKGALNCFFDGLGLILSRPRILVALTLASLVAALPVAFTVHDSAQEHFAHLVPHVEDAPLDFVKTAPDWVFGDWSRAAPSLEGSVQAMMAPSMLAASLLGLLICAGFMSLAVSDRRRHSLSSFLMGGGRHFFPFLRTWVLGLPLFFAVTWLFWGAPSEWLLSKWVPDGDTERIASEATARWVLGSREGLYVAALLVLELILDLARAGMVVRDRRSAVLGMLRGAGRFLQEPLRSLTIVLMGLGLELLWILGCGEAVAQSWLPLWSLVLVIPFGRMAFRGARYLGLAFAVADSITPSPSSSSTPSPS